MVHRRTNHWIRNIIAVAGVALIASTAGIVNAEQPPAPLIDRSLAPLPPAPGQLALDLPVEPPAPPSPQPLRSMALVIERQRGSVQNAQPGKAAGTVRPALRKPDSLRWKADAPRAIASTAPTPQRLPERVINTAKLAANKSPRKPAQAVAETPRNQTPAKQGVARLAPARRFNLAALQPAPAESNTAAQKLKALPPVSGKTTATALPKADSPKIVNRIQPPVTPVIAEEIPTAPVVQSTPLQPSIISPQQEYGVPGLTNLPPATGVDIFGDDFKPIGQVSAVIKPAAGDLPTDFAGPKFAKAGEVMHLPGETRPWAMQCFHWTAPNSNHKPLYFEEVNLERHGYTYGRILQPYISGANFFSSIAILPYKMALDGPCQNIYTLGHYRPGSCAPYERYTVPFEVYPTLVQAGAITALFVIFP